MNIIYGDHCPQFNSNQSFNTITSYHKKIISILFSQGFRKEEISITQEQINIVVQICAGFGQYSMIFKNQILKTIGSVQNELKNILTISNSYNFQLSVNIENQIFYEFNSNNNQNFQNMQNFLKYHIGEPIKKKIKSISSSLNYYQVLDVENYVTQFGPQSIQMSIVPEEIQGRVISISAGPNHSTLLTNDGQCFTLGGHQYKNIKAPKHMQGSIIDVTVGQSFSVFLVQDGTLHCTGENHFDLFKCMDLGQVSNISAKGKTLALIDINGNVMIQGKKQCESNFIDEELRAAAISMGDDLIIMNSIGQIFSQCLKQNSLTKIDFY